MLDFNICCKCFRSYRLLESISSACTFPRFSLAKQLPENSCSNYMYMHLKVLTLYNPPERISFNFCFVETSQGVVRNTTRTLQHPIGGHYIAIISFSARKFDQIEKLFFGLKFSDRNFSTNILRTEERNFCADIC